MEKTLNKLTDKIDNFERMAMLYIFRLRKFFTPKSVEKLSNKVDEVLSEYEELINQYNLIQLNKSTLSRSKRDKVVQRVAFLILKGHISITPNATASVGETYNAIKSKQEPHLKIV